jgi:Mn2+/Fe2+ NRAMP family transporter
LLTVPVLAGSAAYALGEAFEWPVGLAFKANRAKAFYGTIAVAVILGALLNFSPLDPIKALFWSAVINGVVAVPVMAIIMVLASRRTVMGEFLLRPLLKTAGWVATIVMLLAAIGMFATMQF